MRPDQQSLYAYLRRNAGAFENCHALLFEDGTAASHQTLLSLTDAVASRLESLGLDRGDRVALWLQNGVEWVATFLACAKLGLVLVPVNTRLTGEELREIVRLGRVRVVLASPSYRRRAYLGEAEAALGRAEVPPLLMCVEPGCPPEDWRVIGRLPDMGGAPALHPDALAIQFTSGTTTGVPKGVVLTNANYVLAARYASRCLLMTPATPFIGGATFFHTSGSMHCIAACLVSGATLHGMVSWDPEAFVSIVERERCTTAHAPFFVDLMALPRTSTREKLKSLVRTTSAGDGGAFMRGVVAELDIPGLATLYGMTETCGNFTMWFPDDPLEKRTGMHGRPEIGNRLRIIDPASGEAVAPGEVGEIQMSGPGITPGYYDNPSANESGFTGDGWLRSGDTGRLSEAGELSYLGRYKDLIRVGGENMSPAETEQVLLDTGYFGEVCVLAVPDPRLSEVPIAVVIPKADVADWPVVLRQARTRLADFKVPRQIYVAEEFPKTEATRRIQRSVLRDWMMEGRLTRVV